MNGVNYMSIKLQNILLKMANDVLDLEKSGKTLGEPIDEAEQAILDLLDKSLPAEKTKQDVPNPYDVGIAAAVPVSAASGYNQAIADVRKVIKEG